MNPIALNNRRLSACALAVAALAAQSAGAADITTNVVGNYTVGVVGETNVVSISPVSGGGVSFSGDLQLAVGNLTSTVLNIGATRNTIAGQFSTNGQTMNFELAPDAQYDFNVKNGTGSGQMTVNQSAGTGLVMTGTESVGLTLTGSLKNGASALLINNTSVNSAFSVDAYDKTEIDGVVSDNSYVINSRVWKDGNDLRFTASRGKNEYIAKSATLGHFSNPAAMALGTIAFKGSQLGDLVTVMDRMDIDSFGYGNNQVNLAVQVKRLAPIANNAYTLSTLAATSQMMTSVDDRLASLRGDIPAVVVSEGQSLWARARVSNAKQSVVDAYDGYHARFQGLSVGTDRKLDSGWLGLAVNVGSTDIEQDGLRAGEHARVNSVQVSAYGAVDAGAFYLDGAMAVAVSDLLCERATAIYLVAVANFKMQSKELKLGAGHRIKFKDGKSTLTPNISVLASSLEQKEYTETGAGDLGLHFDQKTFNRTRASLGLKFNTEGHLAGRQAYSGFFMNVSRDIGLENLDVTANYSGLTNTTDSTFTTAAAQLVRNSVQLGGGISLAITKTSSLQVRYELDHRQAYNRHGVEIKTLWKF